DAARDAAERLGLLDLVEPLDGARIPRPLTDEGGCRKGEDERPAERGGAGGHRRRAPVPERDVPSDPDDYDERQRVEAAIADDAVDLVEPALRSERADRALRKLLAEKDLIGERRAHRAIVPGKACHHEPVAVDEAERAVLAHRDPRVEAGEELRLDRGDGDAVEGAVLERDAPADAEEP